MKRRSILLWVTVILALLKPAYSWASEDFSMFQPYVSLPENPGQYEVTLSVPMEEEIYRQTSRLWTMLVLPSEEEENLYYLLALLNEEPTWAEGELSVNFCGLLPKAEGARFPLGCQLWQFEDSVSLETVLPVRIDGLKLPGLESMQLRMRLLLEMGTETASVVNSVGEKPEPEDIQATLVLLAPLVITPKEDGGYSLPAMQTDSRAPLVARGNYSGIMPSFEFVPAADYDPLVVFFNEPTDPVGFSILSSYKNAAEGGL